MKPTSPPEPVQLSWTSLKRWEHCRHHHLKVIEHAVSQSQKGRIFLPGTVCDLTQRRWLESNDPQPGEMAEMVETIFYEVVEAREAAIKWKGQPRDDQQRVLSDCRANVIRLEPWLVRNVLPFDYQPEVKFEAHLEVPYICEGSMGPVKLIGGIDIVVRDDAGKFHLYDLKITKDAGYIRSTLAQLIFYDLAWSIINKDWNACVGWGFVTPALTEELIPLSLTQQDRREMLARVIKYAQGVWKDEWAPKSDDDGCDFCEARKVCDKFKVVPVVDANGRMKASFDRAVEARRASRDT